MLTVLEIIKKTTEFLGKRGVDNPRLNSESLIGHALGLKRMQLYLQFERPLTEVDLEKIRPLVKRRAAREPLQYIVGSTEFADLTLKLDRRALIPRPETEYLVELLGDRYATTPPAKVLDLGTGSGAIALALARKWPAAIFTAVDASPDALALAGENATQLGLASRVQFLQSDWFGSVPAGGRFDLIVSNPPYLSDAETDAAAPEVKEFEPRAALSAGPDGTSALARIIRAAPDWLAPAGLLTLETGPSQHAALIGLARERGFTQTESKRDLAGRDRYVLAVL